MKIFAELQGRSVIHDVASQCFTLKYALLYNLVYFESVQELTVRSIEAIVSSKGQVTLPAAMRAKLGIKAGSHIHFELREGELVIKPEIPMSAYYGMLKGFDLGDIEPEKEPDKDFE